MNEQLLYGLPIGTKVTLGGKNGRLTNYSNLLLYKKYEITFDDGEVITREELVEEEELEIVFSLDLVEIKRKRDWYKSEMNKLQRENITLKGRLKEYTESNSIVIEDGDVKAGQKNLDKFLGTETPSVDIYTSSPIGAPIGLATEIAKMLNKENLKKVLLESGGKATVESIADKLNSSAKAVYRFLKKTPGFSVAGLTEPDFKEENADAWLEDQEGVKPEVKSVTDADEQSEDPGTSEESGVPPEVFGAEERSEDEQGGSG